jgi:outer membrane lipoprotein-sorting protein
MRIGRAVSSWFFILSFAVIFFSHALIAGADDQLSSVIDGIFKRYGTLKGLSVPYKREIITKSMAMLGAGVKSETASGTILFRPPNCLEIQQTKPGKETITTDGQTIWYYIVAKNTVYEYPADKLGKEVRLLSDIFTGRIKAGDGFDATQSDLGDKKEYHLKLVPNPAWEEVDHIDLLVERDNFDISVVEIHDLLGTITRFTMEQMTVRKDLRKEDFTFKAPIGVKTIKEGQ